LASRSFASGEVKFFTKNKNDAGKATYLVPMAATGDFSAIIVAVAMASERTLAGSGSNFEMNPYSRASAESKL